MRGDIVYVYSEPVRLVRPARPGAYTCGDLHMSVNGEINGRDRTHISTSKAYQNALLPGWNVDHSTRIQVRHLDTIGPIVERFVTPRELVRIRRVESDHAAHIRSAAAVDKPKAGSRSSSKLGSGAVSEVEITASHRHVLPLALRNIVGRQSVGWSFEASAKSVYSAVNLPESPIRVAVTRAQCVVVGNDRFGPDGVIVQDCLWDRSFDWKVAIEVERIERGSYWSLAASNLLFPGNLQGPCC